MKQAEKTKLLNQLFDVYYDALYQRPDVKTADAVEAVQNALEINAAMKKSFLLLEKSRNDLITSDREYAAFAVAYTELEKAVKHLDEQAREMNRKRRAYQKQYGAFVGDVLYLDALNRA